MKTGKLKEILQPLLERLMAFDRAAMTLTRLGLITVTVWIGGLKIIPYEAEGIIHFVSNSPFMSWLYKDPGNYKKHRNPEGALVQANKDWHLMNGTYPAALFIGAIIVIIGIMIALHWLSPLIGALGGLALFAMSFATLSFLFTTPEAWVPNLGDAHHGFPYLSGVGRLVIKDAIMMGASLVVGIDSARIVLARWSAQDAQENSRAAA